MKVRNSTFTLRLHHDWTLSLMKYYIFEIEIISFFLSQPKFIFIFTFCSILFHSILFYSIESFSISRLLFPMFGLLEHSYRIQVRFSQYHLSGSVASYLQGVHKKLSIFPQGFHNILVYFFVY